MLEDKILEEGLDCCIDEVSDMIQNLVRTVKIVERKEIISEGFTISQSYILIYILKNDHITMNEISEKMKLDKSTITRIVGNLVRDGYIYKKRSNKDGRVYLAKLTDKGRNEADKLNIKLLDFYRDLINEIPEGEVMNVVNSVNILIRALKKIKPNCC